MVLESRGPFNRGASLPRHPENGSTRFARQPPAPFESHACVCYDSTPRWRRSSAGQSSGIIIRVSEVRVLPPLPQHLQGLSLPAPPPDRGHGAVCLPVVRPFCAPAPFSKARRRPQAVKHARRSSLSPANVDCVGGS